MSNEAKQLVDLYEMMSDSVRKLLLEITKKFVCSEDPEYVMLFPEEKARVDEALSDYENGVNIDDGSGIDW